MSAGEGEGLPPPGAVIAGKYEVVRTLGRGGMGVVVQARHLRMEQDVAIKILLPAYREMPEVVARFEREGRAAAQLRDVHVTRVLDVDTLVDGSPFIVMELLRGEDLAEILHRKGKLPYRDAVGYVLEACAAMAEAHRAGIVHRDLKPNNLYVDKQGERPVLKVLDFGISKVTEDSNASMTATATAFGTPLYMSPEQVRSARSVDGRADIWSLGVVLYELLTGVSPFAAEGPTAILAAIIADTPAPVGERRPDLPRALADAVMRALEKNVAARYPDVESFAAALAPFGPGQAEAPAGSLAPAAADRPHVPPASAATNAPLQTAMPPSRAHQRVSVAPVAAGMLLAVVASALLFVGLVRRRHPEAAARPEPTVQATLPAPLPPVVAPEATATAVVTATPAPSTGPSTAEVVTPRTSAVPHVAAPNPVPAEKPTVKPGPPATPAPPPRPPLPPPSNPTYL